MTHADCSSCKCTRERPKTNTLAHCLSLCEVRSTNLLQAGKEAANSPRECADGWRNGEFTDCEIVLGNMKYALHRVMLARGSRKCCFFKGLFNVELASNSIDLTLLLPPDCQEAFEMLLDYVYVGSAKPTSDNVSALYHVADILQNEGCRLFALEAMDVMLGGRDKCASLILRHAISLGIENLAKAITERMPISELHELAQSVELPTPLNVVIPPLLERVSQNVQTFFTLDEPNRIRFNSRGCSRIYPSLFHQNIVAFRVDEMQGTGLTIGVSKGRCDIMPTDCYDGGFARHMSCFGLCIFSGNLWAQGQKLGCVTPSLGSFDAQDLLCRTIIFEVKDFTILMYIVETTSSSTDVDTTERDMNTVVAPLTSNIDDRDVAPSLPSASLESPSGATEVQAVVEEAVEWRLIGTIPLPLAQRFSLDELFFTVSACCGGTMVSLDKIPNRPM